jgi:hypothetical protein
MRLARGEDIDPPTAAKADAKAGEIVVTADTLDAERGQTVTIPISITNATALRAFDAVISYEDDPSLLTLESAEAADDIADVQYQTNVGAGFASLSVCWPSAPVADITLVNLVFRVADTAAIGGSLPILISDIQLKGEYGQDLEWAEAVSVVNGAINVVGAVIEGEPLEGQPLEGQPLEGQPLEGQPLEGQPVEGEPLEGQPVEGEPLEGQPVEGEPLEGQPVEGQPLEGQPVEGEPLEGQPVEGQPLEGEVIEGEPLEGQPAEGEVIEGEPLEGQPVEGQPAEGQPAEGQPAEGQPAEGQQVVEGQPADEGQAVAPIEGEPAPASKGCFG